MLKELLIFLFAFLLLCPSAFSQANVKKQLEAKYAETKGYITATPKTVLVCLSDQIPATVVPTVLEIYSGAAGFTNVKIDIENGQIKGTFGGPLHTYLKKGDLLRVTMRKVHPDYVEFVLHNLNPQAITEGQQTIQRAGGTRFLDKSPRVICAQIRFYFPRKVLAGTDVAPVITEIERWFKSFQDRESAITFLNANSASFIPEIKIGMSLAEVEKILGPPEKKFTFPDKVVYRYKDFSVEFKENIVTDIKF
jgi:hypothetical protein